MKRFLLGALTVASLATTAQAEQSYSLPFTNLNESEPNITSQLPYEVVPKITMSGEHQYYYSAINQTLHSQGFTKKHTFNDDVIGAIYDFDKDGNVEFITKNLESCDFEGCEVTIVKVAKDGTMSLVLQGHAKDVYFGVNPETKKEELYFVQNTRAFKAYTYEDDIFKPQFNHLDTKVETNNLVYLPELDEYLPNLIQQVRGLLNDINTTGGANAYFTKIDINSDGNPETMIVLNKTSGCKQNGDCLHYVFTSLNSTPNFVLEAPFSTIRVGNEGVGEIKSITFEAKKPVTYTYSARERNYIKTEYNN